MGLQTCYLVLKKLHPFLRRAQCSTSFKVQVFNAVLTSKALYGLESVALLQRHLSGLDVFHLKGLRKILHVHTTFIDRGNTNTLVYKQAAQALYKEQLKHGKQSTHSPQLPINNPNKKGPKIPSRPK